MKPVIFFAFANDNDVPKAYLPSLKQEYSGTYSELQHFHDRGLIEIYSLRGATPEDIYQTFTRFRDRIAIFHYGGHASGTALQLENTAGATQMASGKGLAAFFAEQQNLQLVFLNGCSSLGHVQKLLKAGVKAVIATSTAINDVLATDFAQRFYRSLATGANVEKAFMEAKAFVQIKNDQIKFKEKTLSRALGDDEDLKDEQIPWGLYMNENQENAIAWKLPEATPMPPPPKPTPGAAVNQHLILPVFQKMAEYKKSLAKFLIADEDDDEVDPRELQEQIIKNYPWLIGSQLRMLFSTTDVMRQRTLPRLKQIVNAYERTVKFLAFIALSQLWDEKRKNNFTLPQELILQLNIFFEISKANYPRFNHISLVHSIINYFVANQIKPFIEEFTAIQKSIDIKDGFYSSYCYLEEIQNSFENEALLLSRITEYCDQAEYCLAEILKSTAFLVNYKLLTVKAIDVYKPRNKEPQFRHQMGELYGLAMDLIQEKEKEQGKFTDSHSIILAKGSKEIIDFLNLSPFVVDKNAFMGKNIPNVFLYMYAVNDNYGYALADTKDEDDPTLFTTEEEKLAILSEQFAAMKSDLFS